VNEGLYEIDDWLDRLGYFGGVVWGHAVNACNQYGQEEHNRHNYEQHDSNGYKVLALLAIERVIDLEQHDTYLLRYMWSAAQVGALSGTIQGKKPPR
jgi:hypothetical protein